MNSAKVLISMQKAFLADLDLLAAEEHRSRSELIREAIRVYVQRKRSNNTNGELTQ